VVLDPVRRSRHDREIGCEPRRLPGPSHVAAPTCRLRQAVDARQPAVVWVTPDTRRRDQLTERLASENDIVHGLFYIVALDDFEDAITNGPQEPQYPSDKP